MLVDVSLTCEAPEERGLEEDKIAEQMPRVDCEQEVLRTGS
jgi:hypothetical protein